MVSPAFPSKWISPEPDAMALDGSEVRLLCELPRGAMAMFTLPPDAISKAVAHRTIEELWCVIRGRGRIWRKIGDREDVTDLVAGAPVAVPTGARLGLARQQIQAGLPAVHAVDEQQQVDARTPPQRVPRRTI